MASEELPSPTSSRKHRRSSDDHGAEASSKRRKHHHRRHRHRGRHGRESDGGIEVADPASDPEAASLVAAIETVDDEREEGEILEEDEERAGANGAAAHGLNVESDGVDASSDLATPGAKDATSAKSFEVLIHNQNGLTDAKMLEPAPSCENSSYTDQAKPTGDISDGDTFIRKAENLSLSHVVKKTVIQGETRLCQLELSGENEIKHKHQDRNDIKIRVRSRSPGERTPAAKHRKRDDPEDRDSGSVSERLDSKQYLESKDSNRRASDRIRSILPKTLRDGDRDTRTSPSISRHHDEGYHRIRSSSHDHTRRQSYEKILEPSADGNDQIDSHGNRQGDSDRYHALDRYAARSQAKDKINERESSGNRNDDRHGSREGERNGERNSSIVRERDIVDSNERHHRERRSSSYSRYNRGEGRHGSRERDREKERNSSSYRDRDKVDLDKGFHKQREGSSDYSRYNRREANDRARDEPSDIRDNFLQRERLRDGGHGRDRDGDDRDKNRARHKEVYAHEGRNQRVQFETDKRSSRDRHRESRHSKYDGVEHHRGISRSKDDGSSKDIPKADKQKLIRYDFG
ncbi:hypothetical protein GW17_00035775 [Ensete ventricosum]|nr:hypothetical protein GW17_00035775 [Ensete ventricosum]